MSCIRSLLAAIVIALVSGAASPAADPPAQQDGPAAASPPVAVGVDERIELLTMLARLAGFREYTMENASSPYSAAADAHFAPHKDHAAVRMLIELKREHGVSYDAIPSLAMHLGPLPKLLERIPFSQDPPRLDARWGGTRARVFLDLLRRFAHESGAAEFFASQAPFYREAESRLSERLSQSKARAWFDDFFGVKAGASYKAIPGLLCGGGNYGVGVQFIDGTPEEVTPVLGCWIWDDKGFPIFGEGYLPLLVHELCHTYSNPFVDRFETDLHEAGEKIFLANRKSMERQGYGSWKTVMYETLVRACVVRCRQVTEGDVAGREQADEERRRSFAWVPAISELLAQYDADREQYPTFDTFMPRIINMLNEYAAHLEIAVAGEPHVTSLSPPNGALDVDPSVTVMTIRFDRPMRDGSWSIVGRKEDQPEVTGQPSFDESHRVLTVPIRLAPGREYRFFLNSDRFQGFVSEEGVALKSVEVRFWTRPAPDGTLGP